MESQKSISSSKSLKSNKEFRMDGDLFWICGIIILSNCSNGIVAPFLPLELYKRGFDSIKIGIIISTYYLAIAVSDPLNKFMKRILSNRSLLQLGLLLMSIATFFFVHGEFKDQNELTLYFYLCIILRAI